MYSVYISMYVHMYAVYSSASNSLEELSVAHSSTQYLSSVCLQSRMSAARDLFFCDVYLCTYAYYFGAVCRGLWYLDERSSSTLHRLCHGIIVCGMVQFMQAMFIPPTQTFFNCSNHFSQCNSFLLVVQASIFQPLTLGFVLQLSIAARQNPEQKAWVRGYAFSASLCSQLFVLFRDKSYPHNSGATLHMCVCLLACSD